MGDLEEIDAELRLLAAVRSTVAENDGTPSMRLVDELFDERAALSARIPL